MIKEIFPSKKAIARWVGVIALQGRGMSKIESSSRVKNLMQAYIVAIAAL
jgi:hypothetical protein